MKSHQARRAKGTKSKGKFIIIGLVIIILVLVIILVVAEKIRTSKTLEGEEPTGEDVVIEQNHVEQIETVDVSDMPNVMGKYKVVGKIVIDKIEMQSYILGESTKESLNLAVTKFWGPNINDPR